MDEISGSAAQWATALALPAMAFAVLGLTL
jgi:hypothetical protein